MPGRNPVSLLEQHAKPIGCPGAPISSPQPPEYQALNFGANIFCVGKDAPRILITHDKHVLCPGPTGTGKSPGLESRRCCSRAERM